MRGGSSRMQSPSVHSEVALLVPQRRPPSLAAFICHRNPGPSAPLCPGLQSQVPLPWVTRWGSAQGGEGGQRGWWSADGPAPSLLGPPRVGTHPRRSLTPGRQLPVTCLGAWHPLGLLF